MICSNILRNIVTKIKNKKFKIYNYLISGTKFQMEQKSLKLLILIFKLTLINKKLILVKKPSFNMDSIFKKFIKNLLMKTKKLKILQFAFLKIRKKIKAGGKSNVRLKFQITNKLFAFVKLFNLFKKFMILMEFFKIS